MEKYLAIAVLLLMTIAAVGAIPQPQEALPQPNPATFTIEGEPCYEKYKTTEGYCSGNIRIYYQCAPRTSGLEWTRQSENCGDYNGRCVIRDNKATCIVGGPYSGSNITIIIGFIIFIIVVIGVIAIIWRTAKRRKKRRK